RSRSASPAAAPSTSTSNPSTGEHSPAPHVLASLDRGYRGPVTPKAETSIYEALRDALRAEEPVALATVTAGPHVGAKILVPRVGGALGRLGEPDLDRVGARG